MMTKLIRRQWKWLFDDQYHPNHQNVICSICIKSLFTSNSNDLAYKAAQSRENKICNKLIKTPFKSSKIPTSFDPIPIFFRDEFMYQTNKNNSDHGVVNPMKPSSNIVKELN